MMKGEQMSSSPKFFLLKVATLFHDPPDKAWCLKRYEKHEEWAEELAKKALTGTPLENAIDMLSEDLVIDADRLAASIDRKLLGLLVGDKKGALLEKAIKLKNPIDPRIEIDLSNVDVPKEKSLKVMEKLNEILKKIDDLGEAYLALYGLYELVWINEGLPSGPADTRIPTHTVFDHLYATASALNWTYGDGGFLIYLDVAGIQDFISQSRKLRDLWASSYMASTLLWSVVLDFIEKYGPDVIIIPTCRFNFFYYYHLMNIVPKIREYIMEVLNPIYTEWSFPRFAIVPASMTLMLPPIEKDIEASIKEEFKKKWEMFCDGILDCSSEFGLQPLVMRLRENEDYGFAENPPFTIRVSAVKISLKDPSASYSSAFDEVAKKNKMKKLLKEDPACMLPLTKMTKEMFDGKRRGMSRRGFEYCTMCGKLPAIIDEKEIEALKAFLGEGEKLCPYCLIKRIFSFRPGLALSKILGYGADVRIEKYPSLADFSTFDFRDSIISNASKLNELWKYESIRELLEVLLIPFKEEYKSQWKYQERRGKELDKLHINDKLKNYLKNFLFTEAENAILETKGGEVSPRSLWNRVRRELQAKRVLTSSINIYYALIRADGDNIRKIMGGDLSVLGVKVEDYIVNSFEGESKEIIKTLLENGNSAKEIARKKDLDERNINEVSKFMDDIKLMGKLPVSISYHVSVSRALMVAALKDIEIVEKNNGVVIYAGGDDLLSVAPVSFAVKIIDESRLAYGGFVREAHSHKNMRFHKLNNYYIPSMGNMGRSYSLYIAHYKYPLYDVVRASASSLKEIAKESVWICGERKREKDSLVLTYSARGSVESSVIPFSLEKDEFTLTNLIMFLGDMMNMVSSKKVSTTLLYEVSGGNIMKMAESVWKLKEMEIFEELIKYVVKRHLQEEGEFLDKIMKIIKENEDVRRYDAREEIEKPLFLEIFKSCRLLYSGLRGE
jgi:CRISPR-associated protein Cmr2